MDSPCKEGARTTTQLTPPEKLRYPAFDVSHRSPKAGSAGRRHSAAPARLMNEGAHGGNRVSPV